MNITIITTDPFPYGDAASNRIISYSRELVKQDCNICVHCLQPYIRPSHPSNEPKPLVRGTYDGISYIYPAQTVIWPETGKHPLRKIFLKIKSYLGSFVELVKNRKQIDIVQVYTTRLFVFYYYWVICRLLGFKYVVERNELPTVVKNAEYYQRTILRKLYASLTLKSFKCFDGWIIETQYLADYYIPQAKKDTQYCIIPMTVEHERFDVSREETPYGRYIAYCGNMREDDGVSILLEAFSIIHSTVPDVKLLLAGESNDTPQQKEFARKLGIEEYVVFLGKLHRDDVPSLLKNATILALASPTSLRSCASMPCKVGEYLCTGNPIVVTSLGEIPKYLTDGENAYLAEPDSPQKFAEKLKEALNESADKLSAIGLEGQKTAIKHFGSQQQAVQINKFFNSLIK